MIRFFWWIKGAPSSRPGGPWWYKDFTDTEAYRKFKSDILPFCRKIAVDKSPDKASLLMNIYPDNFLIEDVQ